jgi:two-component system sensor histidine kinase QseC
MASYSLRKRLLTLLLVSVFLAWSVTTLLAYVHAHHELDELLDAHLAQAANLLTAQAGDELEEIHLESLADAGPYDQALVFQVWREGERLLLRTPDAPDARLSAVETGFSDVVVDGRHWRVFSSWDRSAGLLVQVAEDHATRDRLLSHYTLSSLPAVLVGLPLLGILVWLVVGAAVRPLAAVGDEVGQRGPADLEPLVVADVPREVQPLLSRLNALFERIRESMLAERRFTSHAAHELRTPIAAIRAQAEVAGRETDPALRGSALMHVIEGCDRAARLVDQMLQLARIDERVQPGSLRATRLDQVAAQVVAELAPPALRLGVTLELVAEAPVEVAADPALLAVLLRNLVDNAIRHGGPPGPVVVHCTDGSRPWLEVEDRGPGVADEERGELGRRFFRAANASSAGSGLGLSIVERVAESCGSRVSYRAGRDGTGLVVRVEFSRPTRS